MLIIFLYESISCSQTYRSYDLKCLCELSIKDQKKKYIISLHQMYLFVMLEKLRKYTCAAIIIQFYN